MAITYSAQSGTTVTGSATDISVSVGDFSGNELSNVTSTLANSNNGNIGTKFPTYVGRILSFIGEYRLIVAESGTAPNITLTLNDEITGADTTSGNARIFYDVDDLETGGASGGITLNSKSGFYELTNTLNIGASGQSTGYLALNSGQCLELDDDGNNFSINVGGSDGSTFGQFVCGYTDRDETPLGGAVIVSYNNSAAENVFFQGVDGAIRLFDTVVWSQRVGVRVTMATPLIDGCTFIDYTTGTNIATNSDFGKPFIFRNSSFTAKSKTNANIKIEWLAHSDSTTFDHYSNIVFNNLNSLQSTNFNTGTLLGLSSQQEYVLKNFKWINCDNPYAQQSLGLNASSYQVAVIDPFWDVTTAADTGFRSNAQAYIYDCSLLEVTVQDNSLAPIADCVVAPYSRFGTGSTDQYINPTTISLVQNVRWTNSDGFVETYFYNRNYSYISDTNSTTTAVSTFVRADAYGYKPYVQGLTQFEPLITSLSLQDDTDLVETVRATAESTFDAASPTLDVRGFDTDLYYIFEFDTGTGTVSVGDTITATSNDTFLVEAFITGNSTEGAILAGPGVGPSGSNWTGSGGWAGNVTAFYPVGAVLDANNGLSIQQVYDGMAAKLAKNTAPLDATFQYPLAQFCETLTTQPITKDGTKWIGNTGRQGGFAVINTTDSIASFSQIGTYVFPFSPTVTFEGVLGNSEIRIYDNPSRLTGGSTSTEVGGVETVEANTTVGNGSDYIFYNTATTNVQVSAAGFAGILSTLQDGDKFRVIIRDNTDNPTLQLFDEFTVNGILGSNFIPTTTPNSGFISVFGNVINGSNSKTVTIEKVNASESFTVSSGTYDIAIFRIASQPVYFLNQSITADGSISVKQVIDRVYNNPPGEALNGTSQSDSISVGGQIETVQLEFGLDAIARYGIQNTNTVGALLITDLKNTSNFEIRRTATSGGGFQSGDFNTLNQWVTWSSALFYENTFAFGDSATFEIRKIGTTSPVLTYTLNVVI